MQIQALQTEEDYNQALKRLELIFDAKPGTLEGDELDLLGDLINNYEEKHFPVELPESIEAIKFRMEQMVVKQ